ncbi:MAG: cob(I)yrinic acid a,c-diamide adenosyltransferase [Fimbriimonadaceae bacterium]|nr:cob(I)yrinic acid a,c-diamide adenosyltransferase [Fimbriimonadaceae bacterium]
MNIYTRRGDDGTSGLIGGRRLPKSDPVFEALGALDELNSSLGVARAQGLSPSVVAVVAEAQAVLLAVGAEIAAPPEDRARYQADLAAETAGLEASIDALTADLPALRRFVLPGGTPAGASLHHARSVCRRAERAVVHWAQDQSVRPETVAYLNRLSDWLFTAARWTNRDQGVGDVEWEPR